MGLEECDANVVVSRECCTFFFFPICLDFIFIPQFLPIWSNLTHLSIWVLEVLVFFFFGVCVCVNLVLKCLWFGELFLISILY